jgi:hypothetical protein
LGTCVASGSWHAKPPRSKGRGAKPSFASMLMSLLTASADAGDDGGFSSPLSVPGDASSPGTSEVFRLTLPRKNQSKSGDYRMLASRRTPNCALSRAIPFVRSRWAATAKRDKPPTW